MKKCFKCQETKPISEFSKNRKQKDGLQTSCKICSSKQMKESYKNKSDYYKSYSVQNRVSYQEKARDFINDIKKTLSCSRCGFSGKDYPKVLDFHHRNPDTKSFELAKGCVYSFDKIKEEIDKCDVLCANCHRIHHS